MALTQITTDGIKDGTITGTDLATNIDLVDNQKLRLGSGTDFQIYHNGNHNFIADTGTGDIRIGADTNITLENAAFNEYKAKFITNGAVELYYDNSKKLQTDTHGITVFRDTGDAFTIVRALENSSSADAAIRLSVSNDSARGMIQFGDSSDADVGNIMYQHNDERMRFYVGAADQFEANTDGIQLDDNKKAQFGNSSDLQIYHDGSNSYIEDAGTGGIVLKSNHLIGNAAAYSFNNAANSETLIYAVENGAVELYYDNVKKLETLSSGVKASGHIFIDDNNKFIAGTGSDLQIYHNGSNSYIENYTGNLVIDNSSAGDVYINAGDDIFIRPQGSENGIKVIGDGAVELYYDNSKKFETNSSGITITGNSYVTGNDDHPDNSQARFGTSNDLKIFHDGSHSYIDNTGTGNLYIKDTGIVRVRTASFGVDNANGTEQLISATADGAVELYHNNVKTFETTTEGATFDTGSSSCVVRLTSNTDAVTVLQGFNSDFNIKAPSGGSVITQVNSNEDAIKAIANGAVELYHNNVQRLETTATGIQVNNGSGNGVLRLKGYGSDHGGARYVDILMDTNATIRTLYQDGLIFNTNQTNRAYFHGTDGHFLPWANNTYDLGSTSNRWRNVYTNDLNLSNEGGANDVDGTWGSYTIQEGAEDLFLVNKRNGKKYKFALTEIL